MKLSEVKPNTKPIKKQVAKGYIIYEGASRINGEQIIAVVTMTSKNIKTGNMASMWILHKDLAPTKAAKQGKDEAVCGGCKLRHFNNGACYVTLHHAPLQVWKAYHKGNYKQLNNAYSIFANTYVRFGAYGDPFAIPLDILSNIKAFAVNNTSYTHQWKTEPDSILKTMSMASADNISEAKEAQKLGWRTFRVAKPDSEILSSEIVCPNYTKGISCLDCGLCNGTKSKAKNIVIMVHGTKVKKFE